MKRLQSLLESIRSLPEEGRRLLAGISFIISVLVVFSLWGAHLSYRLEKIPSGTAVAVFEPEEGEKSDETFGPAKGLAESFRSLGRNLPSVDIKNVDAKKYFNQALTSLAGILFN